MIRKLAALLFAVGISTTSAVCIWPGTGGSIHTAPEVVNVGETIRIELRTHVTDKLPIKGRYSSVLLNYRMVGEQDWKTVKPKQYQLDQYHELYVFELPAVSTPGEIEYEFDVEFDGRRQKFKGTNPSTIRIKA